MKPIALLLVLALAVRAQAPVEPFHEIRHGAFGKTARLGNSFSILVWNIDRDGRPEDIRRGISDQHPDVALLQEVDLQTARAQGRDVAQELGRELSMNYVYGTAFQELHQGIQNKPGYQGQATLARAELQAPRMLRYAEQTAFWNTPLLPSWFPQRRLGGRIALIATIPQTKANIVFYNLHLESRGPGFTRFAQLKETLADADAIPSSTPIVLAGDLNTKYVASKFVDLLSQHGFRSCFAGSQPRTHRIIGSLDWIFLRGNLHCEEPRVLRNVGGSDHYPLVARIRVE